MMMSRLSKPQLEKIWEDAQESYEASGETSGNHELWHEFAKQAAYEMFSVRPEGYRSKVMDDYSISREAAFDYPNEETSAVPYEADMVQNYPYEGTMC